LLCPPDFAKISNQNSFSAAKILHRLDGNFLNWRLADNPVFKYEIVKLSEGQEIIGFLVYKVDEKKRCFIHHLEFAEEKQYEKDFNAVCEYLFEESQSSFLFTFEPTLPVLAKAFKKNWFIKNTFDKGLFSYKPPLIGFSNREKIKNVDFFQKESYDIQPLLRDY
jgi:hypothetical protein